MTERITAVVAGEALPEKIVKDFPQDKVLSSCGGTRGLWYCTTCTVSFINQFEKDTHIHSGTHKLAWVCAYHGFEQP